MINKLNLYDRIIPKGTVLGVTLDFGTPKGAEFLASLYPDDGYLLSISYFILIVPTDELSANVIVETEKGKTTLFQTNVSDGTYVVDASDLRNLDYIKNLSLYVKVLKETSNVRSVVLQLAGKQVIPYVGVVG